MSARNYPLARPAEDPRFTFGLTMAVAEVLTDRGYPALTGGDLVELQQALFRFLYRDSLDSVPAAVEPGEREIPVGDVVAGDRLWVNEQYLRVTSVARVDGGVMVYTDQYPDGVPFDHASSPVKIIRAEGGAR
jgi:hypothetical protein